MRKHGYDGRTKQRYDQETTSIKEVTIFVGPVNDELLENGFDDPTVILYLPVDSQFRISPQTR